MKDWLYGLLLLGALVVGGEESCFTTEHGPCQDVYNFAAYVQLEVLPVVESDSQLFQNVASLVCHHVTPMTNQNATFCWEEEVQPAVCNGLNCSSVMLALAGEGRVLPPSLLRDLLVREDTQLALLLAGYTIHRVYTDEQSAAVPVASWVFLAVGLLLSALVVTKPLWWDRFIVKLYKCTRITEHNDT